MTLSIEDIRQRLELFAGIEPNKTEKTIFSIGGRGHYENPISDVLAFYLDPSEEHGLGDLVLKSFLQTASLDLNAALTENIQREAATENQKRLDLVLVGDDWVMAIENKIYHNANNPFKEYEAYLAKTYPDKTPYFILLSPKGDQAKGWRSMDYGALINNLKSNLGEVFISNPYSKWVVFLRDFLINLSNYVKDASMDDQRFDFLFENMSKLYELEEVKTEFLSATAAKVQAALMQDITEQNIKTAIHKWGGGPSLRFYPEKWPGQSNVALHPRFKTDNKIEVLVYLDKVSDPIIKACKKQFTESIGSMDCWENENNRWSGYRVSQNYDCFEKAMSDLIKLAKLFDDINKTLSAQAGSGAE